MFKFHKVIYVNLVLFRNIPYYACDMVNTNVYLLRSINYRFLTCYVVNIVCVFSTYKLYAMRFKAVRRLHSISYIYQSITY